MKLGHIATLSALVSLIFTSTLAVYAAFNQSGHTGLDLYGAPLNLQLIAPLIVTVAYLVRRFILREQAGIIAVAFIPVFGGLLLLPVL